MAGRNFVDQMAMERDVKELYLKFTSDGAGNFTIVSGKGFFSVAKTGAGIVRITLEDKYPDIKAVNGILVDSTVRNYDIHLKAYNSAAGTIDLFTLIAGTETDLPACDVLVMVIVKNTTATY
jgi:hypothetical protein